MIKINSNEKIANVHYSVLETYLKDCLQFFINCLEIKAGRASDKDINKDIEKLHTATKISLFNVISSNNIKKSQDIINSLKTKKFKRAFSIKAIDFFKDMIDEKKEIYIKNIILGKPNELDKIYKTIKCNYKILFNKSDSMKKIYVDILSKIFNYEKFSDKDRGFKYKKEQWGAYQLLRKLNINVCPYCNRHYTYTIQSSNKNIIRPDIEHFLPQHKYPMFALSFYNLVPSCKDCNSVLKGDRQFQIDDVIHPYMDNEKDRNLNRQIFNIDFDVLKLEDIKNHMEDIEIFLDQGYKLKCKSNENKEFINKMERIYNCHKGIVADLLDKLYTYTDEMLDEICNSLGESSIVRERLYDAIFNEPKEDNEIINTSLGKLKKDIIIRYKRNIIK